MNNSPAPVNMLPDELSTLLTTFLKGEKPKTKKDALKIWADLEVVISHWLVSELSSIEKKEALMVIWTLKGIQNSKCCW